MKKKVMVLLLTMAVSVTAFQGCGRDNNKMNDNKNVTGTDKNKVTATEEMTGNTGTENVAGGTEENTSQLQLGNAVEIPAGWNGELGETKAHGQLENLLADYYNVPQENYADVRYYYNYVDLNGNGRNEVLALVIGDKVNETGGNTLLWLDAKDENFTKDSVLQTFPNVNAPIYISNHMTNGYRDLIVCDTTEKMNNNPTTARANEPNAAAAPENSMNAAGNNNAGGTNNTNTANTANVANNANGTSNINGTDTANTANTANGTNAANATNAGNNAKNTNNSNNTKSMNNTNNGAPEKMHNYTLLTWKGDRYEEVSEGKRLDSLEGLTGDAILTNDMQKDFDTDNYHFLGKALR